MRDEKLPVVKLEGSPAEIGLKHGKLLQHRIKQTIKFYQQVFKKREKEIFDKAKIYRKEIGNFNSDYTIEIENIAKGAKVNPLWIYALNARTEIMSQFVNECTALYTSKNAILGQNWDWAKELEKLAVILRIKGNEKPEIITLSEPGILAKIGMNNKGLGVCLNFLHLNKPLKGVPVHIILRSILETDSLTYAKKIMLDNTSGKASNILVGDSNGKYFNIEFADEDFYVYENEWTNFVHTNHYLQNKSLNNKVHEKLASSFSRFERSTEILENFAADLQSFKSLLGDKKNDVLPICRTYQFNPDIGNSGTVCSIIMDLQNNIFHFTKGNPIENEYQQIGFR